MAPMPLPKSAVWRRRPVMAGVVAVCAIGLGVVAASWGPTGWRMIQLRSGDPGIRRAALRALGGRDGYAAIPAIRAMIAGDPDSRVREAAAYAAMKLGDREASDAIMRAILDRPNEEYAGLMFATLARVAGRDPKVARFVEESAGPGKPPFLRVGAALARAEWFDAGGVEELLTLALSGPREIRGFAGDRLRQYVDPVVELIGARVDIGEPGSNERLVAMLEWWRSHANDRLLADALWFKRGRHDDVRAIERLRHTRDRVGQVLGVF